jgi:hypothetical protein
MQVERWCVSFIKTAAVNPGRGCRPQRGKRARLSWPLSVGASPQPCLCVGGRTCGVAKDKKAAGRHELLDALSGSTSSG